MTQLPSEDGRTPSPTLADYWAGAARWKLARKWTDADLGQPGAGSGAHVEIVDGRWYLFNRTPPRGTCPDGERRVGVHVRASGDRGATWGAPVPIIEPTPGSQWSCAGSDGDAYYDETRRTWRYLFQCKTETGGWQGCYAERSDSDPMGPFAPPPDLRNPVIRSGELWGEICDPGDDCGGQPVRDEGTFNIFRHGDGGFWVSFHGAAGPRGSAALHGRRTSAPGASPSTNRIAGCRPTPSSMRATRPASERIGRPEGRSAQARARSSARPASSMR